MIRVIEEDDGSLTITWDENDPVEKQLNTWSEQDFINLLTEELNKIRSESNE